MTNSPLAPQLVKAGLILLDPSTSTILKVIPLQYNPETLSRTLQIRGGGSEGGAHVDARRLTGPPVETYSLEAVLDASDRLEHAEVTDDIVVSGIQADLAVLETILYPDSGRLKDNHDLASSGSLEIIPAESPLIIFAWSKNRVMPVKITEFSITEENFDTQLNPIRARINIGMQALTINDTGYSSAAGNLYMVYQQQKENFAASYKNSDLNALGLTAESLASALG